MINSNAQRLRRTSMCDTGTKVTCNTRVPQIWGQPNQPEGRNNNSKSFTFREAKVEFPHHFLFDANRVMLIKSPIGFFKRPIQVPDRFPKSRFFKGPDGFRGLSTSP